MSGYTGWLISEATKNRLLDMFPPLYERVIAHHCTHTFGVTKDHPLPTEHSGEVIGIADDKIGVQALVLSIGGTINRPDGSIFHITWSLANGRKAVESNKVIKQNGFTSISPIRIMILPTFFSH